MLNVRGCTTHGKYQKTAPLIDHAIVALCDVRYGAAEVIVESPNTNSIIIIPDL